MPNANLDDVFNFENCTLVQVFNFFGFCGPGVGGVGGTCSGGAKRAAVNNCSMEIIRELLDRPGTG